MIRDLSRDDVSIENSTAACPISNAVPNMIAITGVFANPKKLKLCINDTNATVEYNMTNNAM